MPSNRDKLLKLLLPALTIALVYFGWMGVRKQTELVAKQTELTKTRADTAKAEKTAPLLIAQTRKQVADQQQEVATLTREIEDCLKGQQVAGQRWDVIAVKCASADLRNARIEQLTSMLKSHHLVLLDDAEVEGGKGGRLAQAVDKLAKLLTKETLKPQLRQLHFRGGYREVHDILQELARGDVVAIPVSLTMKPVKEGQKREWTMLVWI